MQIAGERLVNLKYIILPSILDEVVGVIRQPAIEYRLIGVMIVGHADYKPLFHLSESGSESETGCREGLNEVHEQKNR